MPKYRVVREIEVEAEDEVDALAALDQRSGLTVNVEVIPLDDYFDEVEWLKANARGL